MEPPHMMPDFSSLPTEVVLNIYRYCTTTSYLSLTSTCRKLFFLASEARDVLLFHLNNVPGIKLGLEDHALSHSDLWLLFRQRASAHLIGTNFSADCGSYGLNDDSLNTSASTLYEQDGDIVISVVSRGSLEVKLYNANGQLLNVIPSPYADGVGQVIQTLQHGHYISVLYAWQKRTATPDLSPSSETPPSKTPRPHARPSRPLTGNADADTTRRSSCSPTPPATGASQTRYHLIHYSLHDLSDRTFFSLRAPRTCFMPHLLHNYRSKQYKCQNDISICQPIHLAVHNRLKCSITWSETHIGLRSTNKLVVMLYVCDKLPKQHEEGTYTMFKMFPPKIPGTIVSTDSDDSDDNGTGTNPRTRTRHPPYDTYTRDQYKEDMAAISHLRICATSFTSSGTELRFFSAASTVPFASMDIDSSSASKLSLTRLNRKGNVLSPRIERRIPNGLTNNLVFMPRLIFLRTGPLIYGVHAFSTPTTSATGQVQEGECVNTMLRLAVLLPKHPDRYMNVNTNPHLAPYPGTEEHIALVILQTRIEIPFEEDEHYFDQGYIEELEASGDSVRRRTVRQRVVARLWGWRKPEGTNLSGLETVRVSAGGTRVAISDWDRVLVWAIDPAVLVEEWGEEDEVQASETNSDAASVSDSVSTPYSEVVPYSNTQQSDDESDTDSDHGSAAEENGHAQNQILPPVVVQNAAGSVNAATPSTNATANASGNINVNANTANAVSSAAAAILAAQRKGMVRSTRYYPVKRDKMLGSIVEIKPIVLKLPGGAVARKMCWGAMPDVENDNDDESENESEGEDESECERVVDTEDEHEDKRSVSGEAEDGQVDGEDDGEVDDDGGRKRTIFSGDGVVWEKTGSGIHSEGKTYSEDEEEMAEGEAVERTSVADGATATEQEPVTETGEGKNKGPELPKEGKKEVMSPIESWSMNKTMQAMIEEGEEDDDLNDHDYNDGNDDDNDKNEEEKQRQDENVKLIQDSDQDNKADALSKGLQTQSDGNADADITNAEDTADIAIAPATIGIQMTLPAKKRVPYTVQRSHPIESTFRPKPQDLLSRTGSDTEASDAGAATKVEGGEYTSPSQTEHKRLLKGKTPIRNTAEDINDLVELDDEDLALIGMSKPKMVGEAEMNKIDKSKNKGKGKGKGKVNSLSKSTIGGKGRAARTKKRQKRVTEDELVILTDRGVQVWNLGVWARGRRESGFFEQVKGLEGERW